MFGHVGSGTALQVGGSSKQFGWDVDVGVGFQPRWLCPLW